MARRSKSKNNSKSHLAVYIIIGLAVLGVLFAVKMMLNRGSQYFPGLTELPISDYRENPNSLSGNEYRVSGKITEKLKWTPDSGQLISLEVGDDDERQGSIGIKIPADIDKVNLERGQRYTFKIEIDRGGLPIALDVKAK